MTFRDQLTQSLDAEHDPALVEAVARALAETAIRQRRRHDTTPAVLEAMLASSIDYAWREFREDARVALTAQAIYMREQVEL